LWLAFLTTPPLPTSTYFHATSKGHRFAMWEEPGLFSEEIRAAFKPLR
jgi:hypothetical protein